MRIKRAIDPTCKAELGLGHRACACGWCCLRRYAERHGHAALAAELAEPDVATIPYDADKTVEVLVDVR